MHKCTLHKILIVFTLLWESWSRMRYSEGKGIKYSRIWRYSYGRRFSFDSVDVNFEMMNFDYMQIRRFLSKIADWLYILSFFENPIKIMSGNVWSYQKLKEAKKDSSLVPSKGASTIDTLIQISGFHDCKRINFYCFKPLVCGNLVQQH